MCQDAASQNQVALAGAWPGASAPRHRGKGGHRPAPRGAPCSRQGQPLAGHNRHLFLGFDLFSVISKCVKRAALDKLILPFFSVMFKLPAL